MESRESIDYHCSAKQRALRTGRLGPRSTYMSRDGKMAGRAGNASRSYRVLGDRLRELRVGRAWSQREAAERAGFSDRLIRKAERGGPLELKTIALLAQLYSQPGAPVNPQTLLADRLEQANEPSAIYEPLVRRWWQEVWNEGRLESIDELTTPDVVLHADGAEMHGHAELRKRTGAIRAAFSDIEVHLDQVTVSGDWIISRWRVAMTHTGSWMGMPPSHKRIVVNGSTWMRGENGLLAEGWDYWEKQEAADAIRGGRRRDARNVRARRKSQG